MITNSVQRLLHADPRAVGVLARAFWDDPLAQYITPRVPQRRRLVSLFDIVLRYGLLFGEVYCTPGIRGIAIGIPPRNFRINIGRILHVGLWRLPLSVGLPPLVRLMRSLIEMEHLHTRNVGPDHWYLFYLAVDPPYQKRGLGAALIQPILDRAAQEGLACYLETTNPRNVPFYQRCGFKIIDDIQLQGGVPCKTMRRDPERNT
ncbi:MAG TPA: GNAT family N-acetyltransferase [Roseiflexaceae bacterium]|nr:GNAT family N-acetyltransferase [Roseiflexaceae bacterium]